MWTPKRLVLLVLGFVLFLGGYLVYANYLGGINGLPPLPEAYWRQPSIDPDPPPEGRRNRLKEKLQAAFGEDCPEAKRPIKLEVPARGLLLAAEQFSIERDGRVKMSPLSMIVYGKAVGEDKTPEMNTLRCDVAYLTFERPITTVADMAKHRISAGEIAGNIEVVNNRRSRARDDDVVVRVAQGPLYYELKQQKIWTQEFVTLDDLQSKPEPTRITGRGLEIELLADQPPAPGATPKTGGRKRPGESVSGVKLITLNSSVTMNLFVDGKSGFLGNPSANKNKTAKPASDGKPERARVIIKSHGPFRYDVVKDFARFDVPPPSAENPSRYPEQVTVSRVNEPGKFDQLVCEHLELQFKRRDAGAEPQGPPVARPAEKGATGKPSRAEIGGNLQIETAHATGKSVTLASDSEVLEAHGQDFFYDARIRATTLKGNPQSPMWALKEGNHIQAQELLIEQVAEGEQRATARGKGLLRLFDKTTGKRPVEATWDKQMVWGKDGGLEQLHLVGNAVLLDNNQESKQDLRADDLKIWLEAKEPEKTKPASADAKEKQPGRRPHHLVAVGHVRTQTREFIIHDTDRFVVWFKEGVVPERKAASSQAAPAAPATTPEATGPEVPGAVAPSTTTPAAPAKPEPKPIDLSARSVEAYVVRQGERSQLDKLKSEGKVRVKQEPRKPGERGVNIKGETLQMAHHPEGSVLVVTGDERELAELMMDRMAILGPEVNVDQVNNKAWVNGCGAMQLESETDFQGKKLTQPTPLTIHWDQSMYFNGQFAEFHGGQQGGVQADQGTARMACQSMQVFFDKPISLKEGDKSGQGAKVRNLVCDRSARVEDSVKDKEEWLKYTLLEGSAIAYDNEAGRVDASGPGLVRVLQRGGGDKPGATPSLGRTPPPGGESGEPTLTYVSFFQRMRGDNKTNTAHFWGNVRVLHLPSKDPRQPIELERVLEKTLPKGAMYLRSDRLTVLTREAADKQTYQEMEARGRVSVQAEEFSGSAATVTYNEEKDQVIFDGGQGGLATLYKAKGRGVPPDRIQGEKIIYSRKTGQHTGINLRSITGGQ